MRKDSGIKSRGGAARASTIAFVDPASSSGYIYPMVLLIQRGLVKNRDPKTFFKEVVFSGAHDASMRALLNGHVDAIASFDLAREQYLKDPGRARAHRRRRRDAGHPRGGHRRPRRARPRAVSPGCGLPCCRSAAPAHAALLKRLYEIDGFDAADDREYDSVRAAMDLLGARPR